MQYFILRQILILGLDLDKVRISVETPFKFVQAMFISVLSNLGDQA